MQLTQNDRVLAAGIAAAHPLEPANDCGSHFHVAIAYADGAMEGYSGRFVDSFEAACDAQDRMSGRCGKVTVRPSIERTYLEGRARYPHQLHKDAFAEAWRGWTEAYHARGAAEVPTKLYVIAQVAHG